MSTPIATTALTLLNCWYAQNPMATTRDFLYCQDLPMPRCCHAGRCPRLPLQCRRSKIHGMRNALTAARKNTRMFTEMWGHSTGEGLHEHGDVGRHEQLGQREHVRVTETQAALSMNRATRTFASEPVKSTSLSKCPVFPTKALFFNTFM